MNKIVRESLFEFTVDNPYAAMGIGKRPMIEEWLDRCNITGYTIDDDLSINVNHNLYLTKPDGNLPDYIQFNIINGYFSISNCNLTSLRGCPRITTGSFYCRGNLISLEGCPKLVEGGFYCYSYIKRFTKKEVRSLCDVKGYIYL